MSKASDEKGEAGAQVASHLTHRASNPWSKATEIVRDLMSLFRMIRATRKREKWVRRVSAELEERKYRLLLAACCRFIFEAVRRPEVEVPDAMDVLERFADTGKTKTAMREMQRAIPHWRPPRNEPRYVAVYDSLRPEVPTRTLHTITAAISNCHKISQLEAFRELQRIKADLVSRHFSPKKFSSDWRSSEVVELACSMYESRDFSQMGRLADALERAGCNNRKVLEHCRDEQARHYRGCWVMDAVLDGRWTEMHQVKKQEEETNRLLARLSRRDQYEIRNAMQHPNAMLSIKEYMAEWWEGGGEERIAKRAARWSQFLPKLTNEQLRIAARFGSHVAGPHSLVRRIVMEDPAELAQLPAVVYRITWLLNALYPMAGDQPDPLRVLATNDIALARRLSDTPDEMHEEDERFYRIIINAAFRRDSEMVRSLLLTDEANSLRQDMEWLASCLQGIADNSPDLVVRGLQTQLERERRARDKLHFGVTNLEVHGTYRLCRRVSPDLVAGFDTTQEFPWDAEYHAWTEQHEDPLEGIDLRDISPILHDAVVLIEPPDWWTKGTEGSPMDDCEIVLTSVGPNPIKVARIAASMKQVSEEKAQEMIQNCPIAVTRVIPRMQADGVKQYLASEGASVQVRKV